LEIAAFSVEYLVAPRAYWKGYLKLSLVSCPIALYPATSEREKISFHQLNKNTGHRIKYRKVDADTGDEVESTDIIKGYQVGKGEYLDLDPEELEAIAIESKRTIEIDEFVPRKEPRAARAQQAAMPVIGSLGAVSPEGFSDRLRGFRQGLRDTGYVEGENVAIEYRWAENQLERLPGLAADLVRGQVTVIVAHGGTAPAMAVKAATTTIPVVFTVPDWWPASPAREETSPASIFSSANWWRSGWSSCASWCPR
jgi:Ku70/Ku80 beta-barrel domain/ABC transporter substrate binding protein